MLGGCIGVLGGEWRYMRYNAVISSLQEENQWSLLASAERQSIGLTLPLSLCLKRKTANPVQQGALGFQEHTHIIVFPPSPDVIHSVAPKFNIKLN